jgi:hypothetical protein
MKNDKSDLRQILDLFEEAGFTVTYYQQEEIASGREYDIAFKTNTISDARFEPDTVDTGDVISLIKRHNYRLLYLKCHTYGKYGGSTFIKMDKVQDED